MRTPGLVISIVMVGCAGCAAVDPGGPGDSGDGNEPGGAAGIPDVRCDGEPQAGPAGGFRHTTSALISELGGPVHRGFDLVISGDAAVQALEGWISYTVADKALEDEDVELFACHAGSWRLVGAARTDDDGRFGLALSGAARLPVGMRDLFVSVVGDRTGARFLGYVAPAGTRLIVSDVDGTLTSSENAFAETIVLGTEPDARAGAPRAYNAVAARGYQLVYVTARGNQFTAATRAWLAHKGFPRGPVRLSPSFITLPGGDTSDYKRATLAALADGGLELAAGIGNRASDVVAYRDAGMPPGRIFIEMPEYADEVQPHLDASAAIGFATYDELLASQLAGLP